MLSPFTPVGSRFSDDDRLVGIALNWVEVEPALPLLEECNRLKALLGAQEEALASVKHQLAAVEAEHRQASK